ncbi:MAG: hypothetical protein B7Y48_10770 [Methylophilales bacterium 28-44-11]|nr:MAG: hypothetical protein B7Y48_10770 [Methylophilales bacterium 28-44-11]
MNWNSIKAWWFDPTTKRLGYAVIISLFLHVLFIEQSDWVALSSFARPFSAIQAELVIAKPDVVTRAVINDVQEQVAPENNTKEAETTEVSEYPPAIVEEIMPDEYVASASEDNTMTEVIEEVSAEDLTLNTEANVAPEQGLLLPDTNEEAVKTQPFTMVETDFDVLMNHNVERVGTAKIHYAKGNNQSYEITWTVSATGFVGLLYPDLLQTSQGKIIEAGLQPSFYLYKFGEREDKSYQAEFNWISQELVLQSTKDTKRLPLTDEAKAGEVQDFLSFMYQFMFVPPLEKMQMYLTNGRKLGTYAYAFEGEEALELKFGKVLTYHIQHAKVDSDERTELWLAVDYQYVPVKIRKTEKDGTVIEQIATKLKFETIENETPLP